MTRLRAGGYLLTAGSPVSILRGMKRRRFILICCGLVACTSLAAARPCGEEQLKHCGHLVNQDKHLIAACFLENMDNFSETCREDARAVIQRINESEYCRSDFQRYCDYDGPIPPSIPDMEHLFPCMIRYHDDFTEECQRYIAENVKEMEQ